MRAFDGFDRFAHVDRDADVTLDRLVERFAELRAQSLARLDELVGDEAELDKRGLHPALGEVTLRELLATWAVHDLDHVSQVFAGMAGSMTTPWARGGPTSESCSGGTTRPRSPADRLAAWIAAARATRRGMAQWPPSALSC